MHLSPYVSTTKRFIMYYTTWDALPWYATSAVVALASILTILILHIDVFFSTKWKYWWESLKKIKAIWHICSSISNTGMIIGIINFMWVSVATNYWEILFVHTYLIYSLYILRNKNSKIGRTQYPIACETCTGSTKSTTIFRFIPREEWNIIFFSVVPYYFPYPFQDLRRNI